jgi:glycosyltransferase involved in cell wall biosynthesis
MISVIIPVFNGEKYLDECLSSIKNTGIEIIVVNDASTDNSVNIAKKYTDKIITINKSGPVVARNTGLQSANGEYVMFMDADDKLVDNAFDILIQNINGYDAVIGLRQDFISPDCVDTYTPITEQKKSSHGVIAGCCLIKKSVFDTVGDFDSDLMCGDGYDWLLRAEESGIKINKIDSVVCNRRLHNSNMGRTLKNQECIDYVKIIRKHFTKKN